MVKKSKKAEKSKEEMKKGTKSIPADPSSWWEERLKITRRPGLKKEERISEEEPEKKDILTTWADSYTAMTRTWEDSYFKIYKPWMESAEDMADRAVHIPQDVMPEKQRELYDEWMKTYQKTFGRFYPFPTLKSFRETLEGLVSSAQESNKFYKSWIARLEENSRITQDVLISEPDPLKYKECYETWIKSYEKTFDEFLEMPAIESTKEIYENLTGIPDVYMENFVQMLKLWKSTFRKFYGPWTESTSILFEKMAEISKGEVKPETYKEFYDAWMDAYYRMSGDYVYPVKFSKEVIEDFVQSTNIYLNMYKSWITALEKLSEKVKEISIESNDPETYKEFNELMTRTYKKAFERFFEDIPGLGGRTPPMMEPVKNAAKFYSEMFFMLSRIWVEPYQGSAGKV